MSEKLVDNNWISLQSWLSIFKIFIILGVVSFYNWAICWCC